MSAVDTFLHYRIPGGVITFAPYGRYPTWEDLQDSGSDGVGFVSYWTAWCDRYRGPLGLGSFVPNGTRIQSFDTSTLQIPTS